jgi:hypothetical protein
MPRRVDDDQRLVARQAFAGMIWGKQFYHYDVLAGSTATRSNRHRRTRRWGRNAQWRHLEA